MPGSVIIDLEGFELSVEDRELIQHPAVAGIILFTRNYQDKAQLKHLTDSILKIRQPLIISVDQEGGRVQRFRSEFTALPPMRHWGERYQEDPVAAKTELVAMIRVMAAELFTVGVNLTWAPVLDVDHGVSEIIGNRSFSADPLVVTNLARVVIDTLHECGMPATGKHFPGHGAVKADSHTELPVDHRPWNEIAQTDLEPFAALVDSLDAIMPAHIVYSELDNLPAGFSSYWLQTVLRKQLGFTGVIVSDDLTMAGAAMAGSYSDRAALALEAGCDLLPVCNNRAGAIEVLHSLEKYKNLESAQRVNDFLQRLKPC